MAYKTLLVELTDGVLHVSLNRPEVHNAFNDELIAEAVDLFSSLDVDAARAIVLKGAGKTFCAGADLNWMSRMVSYTFDENVSDALAMASMFSALDNLPIPLIGRVHGAALGGGAGLAAVCDIVVASDDALFGFTEAKLGILPAVISPFVVQKIGVSSARELFLTGARFSASRARELGLVHSVVPAGDLDAAIDGYVRELLTSAPHAIAAAKQLIAAVADRVPAEVSDITAETIARHRISDEGQDGMRSFLEKRKPSWTE